MCWSIFQLRMSIKAILRARYFIDVDVAAYFLLYLLVSSLVRFKLCVGIVFVKTFHNSAYGCVVTFIQVGQRLLQLDVITESLSKQVVEHHEEMGTSCIFVCFPCLLTLLN